MFSGAVGAVGYFAAKPYIDEYKEKKLGKGTVVNLNVQKDCSKVADVIDIESLGEKTCFCRCWRSKKVSNKIVEIIKGKSALRMAAFNRILNYEV